MSTPFCNGHYAYSHLHIRAFCCMSFRCPYTFVDRESVLEHFDEGHDEDSGRFRCCFPSCKMKFSERKAVIFHVKKDHEDEDERVVRIQRAVKNLSSAGRKTKECSNFGFGTPRTRRINSLGSESEVSDSDDDDPLHLPPPIPRDVRLQNPPQPQLAPPSPMMFDPPPLKKKDDFELTLEDLLFGSTKDKDVKPKLFPTELITLQTMLFSSPKIDWRKVTKLGLQRKWKVLPILKTLKGKRNKQ